MRRNVQVKSDLKSALTLRNSNWPANMFPPYLISAIKQFQNNQIEVCTLNRIYFRSSLSPSFEIDLVCMTDFSNISVGALSDTIANVIFSDSRKKIIIYILIRYWKAL